MGLHGGRKTGQNSAKKRAKKRAKSGKTLKANAGLQLGLSRVQLQVLQNDEMSIEWGSMVGEKPAKKRGEKSPKSCLGIYIINLRTVLNRLR
jgi:hypothetical protein